MAVGRNVDVDARGGMYGGALQVVSAGGHKAAVRLLLEQQADVNARGELYDGALPAASAGGREVSRAAGAGEEGGCQLAGRRVRRHVPVGVGSQS